MLDLKNTTALVKSILEQDKQCRNSDSYLYLKVLTSVAYRKGISLYSMTVSDFLMNYHGTDFPPFESVRRARQKLQARFPDLAACEAVEGFRADNEQHYKAYARGEV